MTQANFEIEAVFDGEPRGRNVLPGGHLEGRALQLGHTVGIEVLRGAGSEEPVPDGAGAVIVGRVAGARNDYVDGVGHK